ncbi:glycosyltransferase family 25 protein [Actibacterium pelagium]|uniref:Uncharacterized protein n=1 Tax=Actibacterium pelagium TaxID=2029103 RepID=A0A917ELI5_9RHOB|nr:hypothetical protein [Actibacterium pelagium]GGE58827.1 hypothetical protein GCM10011517_28100 [Actibacterium pelagium]
MEIFLALIHNNDAGRLDVIRPGIQALSKALAASASVSSHEFSHQDLRAEFSAKSALKRDLRAQMLFHSWDKYLTRKTRRKVFVSQLLSIVKTHLKRTPKEQERARRNALIQMSVTDKHLRAWDSFLESGANHLLVLEDDALFKPDSIERFCSAFQGLKNQRTETQSFYWDLAGGFDLIDIGVLALEKERTGDQISFRKPVTNTTCGYLMSRKLIESLRAQLLTNPLYREISIDWMLNRLLLDLEQDMQLTECIHFLPPIFSHGSFSGAFEAWER